MKKIIISLLLSIVVFLSNCYVYAEIGEEPALNSYGFYSVNNAACVYNYAKRRDKVKIYFKDDTLSSISFVDSNSGLAIYEGTINFESFFDKSSKEFKCPEELYIMLSIDNSRGSGQGYYIDLGYDPINDIIPHDTLSIISEDSYVEYNKKEDVGDSEETYNIICKLKKITNSGNSTDIQYAAPLILTYVNDANGNTLFISNAKNKYTIKSGSFDCSSIIDLTVLIDMDLKEIIIPTNPCSEGITRNCVRYERYDYANNGNDSGVNPDGSNDNSSGLVLPSRVDFAVPSLIPLDCTSLLGSPTDEGTPAYYLTKAFSIIRYVAIILLVLLSAMDFFGAITAQDDDEMKKVINKTIKRFILCVIIFLLPVLIRFVLQFIDKEAIELCINS